MTLPLPKTRFFGRREDLVRLYALCEAKTPLVTLWGPPGIGKTRLAIELCRQRPLEPAWFCDLTLAKTSADACAAILAALGIDAPPHNASPSWVGAALALRGPGALVLDNFEHLASSAVETVGVWMEAAPQVLFLVTSRERLRLQGEVAHEVLPLTEAALLFLDRVSARTDRPVQPLEAGVVEALVAQLEGIPLAIELAAARFDVLGLEGLRSRLSRPLELLGCGAPRDADPHHATLRHAIDSSFAQLTPGEQRVLAHCSVMHGSFALEAAEAIVGPGENVLDGLQSLRDRSLLRCVPENGAVRFSFFESIRAYALEVLAAGGEERDVRVRHAR